MAKAGSQHSTPPHPSAAAPLLPRGRYDVYTDGSVFNGGTHAGIGWVIVDSTTGTTIEEGGRAVDECKRSTSTLAEIYAVSAALARLTAGCVVKLHGDDRDLCHVIGKDATAARMARHDARPVMHDAYRGLFNALARHAVIGADKAHIDDQPHLLSAHHLARSYAAPRLRVA